MLAHNPLHRSGRAVVGIESRRARRQVERYHVRPFGYGVGSEFHHGPRFLKPPYDSGRSVFPSPVLASALLAIYQGGPSPTIRGCGADTPFTPTPWSLLRPFAAERRPGDPAQSLAAPQLPWPPSAQSPFARGGRYPQRGGLADRLEEHCLFVLAHTGSCAEPSPSPHLRWSRCARGLCTYSSVRAGQRSFRHYLCTPAQAPGPIPRRPPRVHLFISSSRTPASHHGNRARWTEVSLQCSFHRGPYFGAAVIRFASGSYAR